MKKMKTEQEIRDEITNTQRSITQLQSRYSGPHDEVVTEMGVILFRVYINALQWVLE